MLKSGTTGLGQRACRLEWYLRGGRAGEDWVLRTGIMVQDGASGEVIPANVFLRRQLNRLIHKLSSPAKRSGPAAAAIALDRDLIAETRQVLRNPVDMAQNFGTISTLTMLMGNFCDACTAIYDGTFNKDSVDSEESEFVLALDAYTLGIIAPRYYSRKREQIPGALPCSIFLGVITPDSEETAWSASSKDGSLGISMGRAMQNALNCQFPGNSEESKAKMRKWLSGVGNRFTAACAEHSITNAELTAIANASD